MGATSVTGKGPGSADGKNRGSEHQTLGFSHIIENPEMGKVFTNFWDANNSDWNALSVAAFGSSSLGQFWIGFHGSAMNTWKLGFVNSAEITSENIVSIMNDPEKSIASIVFSDVPPQTAVCPFTSRQITVTSSGLNTDQVFPIVVWEWNGQPFTLSLAMSGPF
jgi:hypothetical protein